MTVKEFITIIEGTKFICRSNTYNSNEKFIREKGVKSFNIEKFGHYWKGSWNAGTRVCIVIEKDYKIFREYRSLNALLSDEEVLSMDIIVIKELKLIHDHWESSTGNEYDEDDSSQIVICVK